MIRSFGAWDGLVPAKSLTVRRRGIVSHVAPALGPSVFVSFCGAKQRGQTAKRQATKTYLPWCGNRRNYFSYTNTRSAVIAAKIEVRFFVTQTHTHTHTHTHHFPGLLCKHVRVHVLAAKEQQ